MKCITANDFIKKIEEQEYNHESTTSVQQYNILRKVIDTNPVLVIDAKIVEVSFSDIVFSALFNGRSYKISIFDYGNLERVDESRIAAQERVDGLEKDFEEWNEKHTIDWPLLDVARDANVKLHSLEEEYDRLEKKRNLYGQYTATLKKGQIMPLMIENYFFDGSELNGFLRVEDIDHKIDGEIQQKRQRKSQQEQEQIQRYYEEQSRLENDRIAIDLQRREKEKALNEKGKIIDGIKGTIFGGFSGFFLGAIIGFILSIGSCIFTGKSREDVYESIGGISLALVGGM